MKNENKTADLRNMLDEEKLISVAGGEEGGTYRYRVRIGDFVFTSSDRSMCDVISIWEDVDTNDPNRAVRVQRLDDSSQYIGINVYSEMTISSLYSTYIFNGGVIYGMGNR